jgi:hypothetical protein
MERAVRQNSLPFFLKRIAVASAIKKPTKSPHRFWLILCFAVFKKIDKVLDISANLLKLENDDLDNS